MARLDQEKLTFSQFYNQTTLANSISPNQPQRGTYSYSKSKKDTYTGSKKANLSYNNGSFTTSHKAYAETPLDISEDNITPEMDHIME